MKTKKEEQELFFNRIWCHWRERISEEFVSKEILFQAVNGGTISDKLIMIRASCRADVEIALDAFAKSGPDFAAWQKLMDGAETWNAKDFYRLPPLQDCGLGWSYQVTRDGTMGYVRKEKLTDEERKFSLAALEKAAKERREEAAALNRETGAMLKDPLMDMLRKEYYQSITANELAQCVSARIDKNPQGPKIRELLYYDRVKKVGSTCLISWKELAKPSARQPAKTVTRVAPRLSRQIDLKESQAAATLRETDSSL